jgi:hypothetical protein
MNNRFVLTGLGTVAIQILSMVGAGSFCLARDAGPGIVVTCQSADATTKPDMFGDYVQVSYVRSNTEPPVRASATTTRSSAEELCGVILSVAKDKLGLRAEAEGPMTVVIYGNTVRLSLPNGVKATFVEF